MKNTAGRQCKIRAFMTSACSAILPEIQLKGCSLRHSACAHACHNVNAWSSKASRTFYLEAGLASRTCMRLPRPCKEWRGPADPGPVEHTTRAWLSIPQVACQMPWCISLILVSDRPGAWAILHTARHRERPGVAQPRLPNHGLPQQCSRGLHTQKACLQAGTWLEAITRSGRLGGSGEPVHCPTPHAQGKTAGRRQCVPAPPSPHQQHAPWP